MKPVFGIDFETCPACGGAVRIIAAIEDPVVIQKIFDHLKTDDGVGIDNDFTQRNTTIMTWNVLHVARMLKEAGGWPHHGNDRKAWRSGCRFGYENPEHRA